MDGAMPGAPDDGAVGAFRPLPDLASSTSRAMTRPCGPEPLMRASSMPASLARRRASGEENVLAWPLACGAPSPAAFGGDLSPVGRGEGDAGFVGASAF